MAKEEKIRVLVTSLDAGGGHKAIKDSLVQSLKESYRLNLQEYHSSQQIYDKVYKILARLPFLWYLAYQQGGFFLKYFKLLINLPELLGIEREIEAFNPHVVLSTHPIQSILFLQLRKKYHLNYQVATVVCDYGEQKTWLHLDSLSDTYLVGDEWTKRYASKFINQKKIFVFGTVVKECFKTAKKDPLCFKDIVAELFPGKPFVAKKKNLLFIGGSGWTRNSRKLIKELNNHKKYNVFVSCGKDEKLKIELSSCKNIYPFAFISQEKLAIIEKNVDLTVMSSLGRATMHEILQVNEYPLFVHRYIKGQESPHIKLIKEWGVGIYEPDNKKMMKLIEDYLGSPERYRNLISNGKKIRDKEERNSLNNWTIVEQIYQNL